MTNATLNRFLDSIALEKGAEVLWLGAGAPPKALTDRGLRVKAWTDPERLDLPEATFRAAIVPDAMGAYEWDRWLLQELQRVLAPGGTWSSRCPTS